MNRNSRLIATLALLALLAPASALAQGDGGAIVVGFDDDDDEEQAVVIGLDEDDDDEDEDEEQAESAKERSTRHHLSGVDVIGETPEELDVIPGSAAVLSEEDLKRQRPMTANEALRMVPGLTVQDEEGMGLRQNVGIRGLNPIRSRKVLILEDGIPIAMDPYGGPDMYFTPPIERMERVEVVKGAGSILFGPQTIGGVINYITPDSPEEFTIDADIQGGTYGHASGRVSVGDTYGNFGYRLSAMHQRFDGPRNLNLDRTDVNLKLNAKMSPNQSVALKLGVYDETSASTYLGLTTPQYEENRNFSFAENDEFNLRRYSAALTHTAYLSDSALLETRAYAHNIHRDWRRQDFDRKDEGYDYERIIDGRGRDITGSANLPDDGSAIYFRDSSGNRNRLFTIAGVEPRLTVDWNAGPIENELQTGLRFHYEQTRDHYVAGDHATARSGNIRTDQEYLGQAVAAYALNRFMFLDRRLVISPGARVESLWSDKIVYRDRTDNNPPLDNPQHHLAILPGAGASFQVAEPVTLFAGAHRGWAPPQTKDGVTTDEGSITLEAETSWNYELGARFRHADWIAGELTGFYLDFSNQVISPNEASGAVTDGLVNGGATTHVGAEVGLNIDPARAFDLSFGLPLMVNYTYVHTEFGDGWRGDLQGNTLPYAPEHLASGHIGFEHPLGLSLQLNAHYMGARYSDKEQTVEPSVDGLVGKLAPHFLLGAQASYTYEPANLTVYVVGKNLLDQNYIASRSPRGVQPGMPRHLFGGLRWVY